MVAVVDLGQKHEHSLIGVHVKSADFAQALYEIQASADVVVIRLNEYGGSLPAARETARAVRRARPLVVVEVVHMTDVGAVIASAADFACTAPDGFVAFDSHGWPADGPPHLQECAKESALGRNLLAYAISRQNTECSFSASFLKLPLRKTLSEAMNLATTDTWHPAAGRLRQLVRGLHTDEDAARGLYFSLRRELAAAESGDRQAAVRGNQLLERLDAIVERNEAFKRWVFGHSESSYREWIGEVRSRLLKALP